MPLEDAGFLRHRLLAPGRIPPAFDPMHLVDVGTGTPPLRVRLTLAQDPNSENLGTTVWDASIVLAKFLEKVVQASAAMTARWGAHSLLDPTNAARPR